MRNSFKALLFAATIILSASCFRDYAEPGPVDRQVSDGPVEIQLMLNAPGEFTQAETRAMTYAQENTISDVRVLVFDQTGKLTSVKAGENVADKTATQTTPSTGISGGGSFSVMLDPSMGGGTSNLVVLTNLAGVQGAVAAVEGLAVNTSYADAMNAVFGNVSAPLYTTGGTIPMWGETGQISISPSNAQQNVKLLRSVARIDVGVGVPSRNSANDAWTWSGKNATNENVPFKLTGVYVMRPNDRFAVAPAVANVSGGKATAPTAVGSKFTAAVSSTTFNYAVANELFTTRSIYTPEAEVIMNGTQGDSNHKERMAIVVCGFYGSDATPSYYRLDFAKGGNLMNVLRNRLSQFNITKVSGSGYGSAIEAYEANAMNMTAEIYSWDEEEISDFQFDGTYRFGVSTRSVEFSAAGGETRTIVIDTNVPAIAFSLAGAKEMQTGDTFDGSYENENYKYTLGNTASEQYTLTVESKRSYTI